jgi:dimethylamine monooxygenase subunit B
MSAAREGWRSLVVAAADRDGEIRHLRLADPGGARLPSFAPGSHIVLDAGGRANAYSLTGETFDPQAYTVSVLRLDDGDGGSRWIHDTLAVGDRIDVSPPRSTFAPVASARHHLLIAGGIGVTPILSHTRAAAALGRSFEVVLSHRPGRATHLEALRELCPPGRLATATSPEATRQVVIDRLADQPLGTVLYVCGPTAMMEAVIDAAQALGWPPERIHTEAFTTGALDPGEPFVARLASGRRIEVPSGISLLEALESSGVEVSNLCRQGVCGECRVGVVAGVPLHRDLFLTDEEKEAGDCVMCCVSRSRGPELELAL